MHCTHLYAIRACLRAIYDPTSYAALPSSHRYTPAAVVDQKRTSDGSPRGASIPAATSRRHHHSPSSSPALTNYSTKRRDIAHNIPSFLKKVISEARRVYRLLFGQKYVSLDGCLPKGDLSYNPPGLDSVALLRFLTCAAPRAIMSPLLSSVFSPPLPQPPPPSPPPLLWRQEMTGLLFS